jgi:hypothetical protein
MAVRNSTDLAKFRKTWALRIKVQTGHRYGIVVHEVSGNCVTNDTRHFATLTERKAAEKAVKALRNPSITVDYVW